MVFGAQFVTMASPTLQLMLCVSSWGSLLLKDGPTLVHRGNCGKHRGRGWGGCVCVCMYA